jgi:hypothetical protein
VAGLWPRLPGLLSCNEQSEPPRQLGMIECTLRFLILLGRRGQRDLPDDKNHRTEKAMMRTVATIASSWMSSVSARPFQCNCAVLIGGIHKELGSKPCVDLVGNPFCIRN